MVLCDLRREGLNKIKEVFIRFDERCMEMSDFKFTFYVLGLRMILFLITLPIDTMSLGLEGVKNYPVEVRPDNIRFISSFISIVIIVPYIETIVFHAVPLGLYYRFRNKFDIDKYWNFIAGGLCGLIFGVLHGINYPLIASKGFDFTIIGCLYSYTFFRYRRLDKKGRYGVWIIHALNNLIAISPELVAVIFK